MITKFENGNTRVEEYSFDAFLVEFQQAVLDGYRLDLTSNENFPQKFGSHMVVTLVEATEAPVVEVPQEPIVDTPQVPVVEVSNTVVVPTEAPVRRKRQTAE